MYTLNQLPPSFFERSSAIVAQDLIGKLLIRTINNHQIILRIIETEAYGYTDDPASHTYKGMNNKNRAMFGPVGHAYVYLSYGIHHCLNIVSRDPSTEAGGVLIRALEIVQAPDHILILDTRVCSGPGKLTKFLDIDLRHNGVALGNDLCIVDAPITQVVADTRVGISKATEVLWRFVEKDNPRISRPIQNKK
jgi:DNA-3-methyladenine glycosylase